MRVTFVTAGGEIRLPELLQTIRQTPGVSNASLHQHKELTEAIFILDMPGFISHKKLGTAMGTRHGEH